MTKVGRLFEEEKVEAVNKAVNEAYYSMAEKMLLDNEDIIKIMRYTGLPKNEILKIQEELE